MTAHLRRILLFSRFQVPLQFFTQAMAAYSCFNISQYLIIFINFIKKYGRVQEILVGSSVEGASTCRLMKYPRSYGEMDTLFVEHELYEKSSKLRRHSGRPGWYWLVNWISFASIR